jgi:hypothetical protein
VEIWYIFSSFGILYQEKSGNPVQEREERENSRLISTPISGGFALNEGHHFFAIRIEELNN